MEWWAAGEVWKTASFGRMRWNITQTKYANSLTQNHHRWHAECLQRILCNWVVQRVAWPTNLSSRRQTVSGKHCVPTKEVTTGVKLTSLVATAGSVKHVEWPFWLMSPVTGQIQRGTGLRIFERLDLEMVCLPLQQWFSTWKYSWSHKMETEKR